jgi:hypothetical protein
MLILNDQLGSIVSVEPRWRDRLHARLRADRIDHQLATGASPDGELAAALRARTLTSTRYRRSLAAGVQRVISEAMSPSGPSTARLPLNRGHVRQALGDLKELHATLVASGPVHAAGVAQTKLLLTEGSGPLRGRCDVEDLGRTVRRATRALDPFGRPHTLNSAPFR